MIRLLNRLKHKIVESLRFELRRVEYLERLMINQGAELSCVRQPLYQDSKTNFKDFEFSVFSQFGEDGIIQFLTSILTIENKTFIEFGVEDFTESNCRFLMMKDNWSGFVIDGSPKSIERLKNSYYFWKYDLRVKNAFIDKENINQLLDESGFHSDIGIMSIDLDGNDYFVLSSIKNWAPRILVCEYNPLFGPTRKLSIPYNPNFQRFRANSSGLYWGASLAAMTVAAEQLGYALVGTNSAGHNAFFVRNDIIKAPLTKLSPEEAFITPTYRDSRSTDGTLNFLTFQERQLLLSGLPLLNIETSEIEYF